MTYAEKYKRPADQWKHEGICGDCRKRDYCQKQCSANKRRVEAAVRRAIANHSATRALTGTMDNLGVEREYMDY